MKKTILGLCVVSMLILYTGCQSADTGKQNTVLKDSFTEEDEDVVLLEESAVADDMEIQIVGGTGKRKNFLDGLLGSSFKYVVYDEFSLFAPGVTNKLKQGAGMAIYVPKTDTAGFGANCLAAYYFMHFDADARKSIISAYQQYLKDFENKNLNRKDKNSFKIYGSVPVKLNWGSVKTSCPNNGETKCFVGYEFKDGSPYFKLSSYPTLNYRYPEDDSASPESIYLNFYFTKAQGAALTAILSDDEIQMAIREYNREVYGGDLVDSDNYQ